MRKLYVIVTLLLFSLNFNVFAKTNKRQGRNQGPKLQTEINFGDSNVLGKYEKAAEAKAIVENEKSLIHFVEPRKSFKFRIQQSEEWSP